MDAWIRRKLRCFRLKQCKLTYSIYKYLVRLGISTQSAWKLALSGKGWWRMSHSPAIDRAMSNTWFKDLGLVNLEDKINMFQNLVKTAVCDDARTVV